MATEPVKSGIGGWLLVLCGVLLVWQPISLGLVASSALDAVAVRGAPAALALAVRVLVTAFGIAAGLSLLGASPGAVAMTRLSLIASTLTDLFVYATPFFPNNRAPGDTPFYVAASLASSAIWLLYLSRSKRVRQTFEGTRPVTRPPLPSSRPAPR